MQFYNIQQYNNEDGIMLLTKRLYCYWLNFIGNNQLLVGLLTFLSALVIVLIAWVCIRSIFLYLKNKLSNN